MPTNKALSVLMSIIVLIGASHLSWSDHRGGHWGDFRHYDHHYWRSGHWVNGWHGGHAGWWWVLGSTWLLYNSVVYPYPSQEIAPVYVINEPVQAIPVAPVPPPPATITANQVWYHCRSPQGYYPYIPTCPSGWQTVPAVPADLPH